MKNLEDIFDSNFHGKLRFTDFLQCNIAGEYESFQVKDRTILNPSSKLKSYHRFLNNFVFEFTNILTDVVYSYRKGFNAYHAVSKHAGSNFFFKTDLNNFFRSIKKEHIESIITSNLKNFPASDINIHLDRIIELVCINDELPVGFSTSPLISNACLFKFDTELKEYCDANNLIYTRYSDDLIISSNEYSPLLELADKIKEILKENFGDNLTINMSKTKILKVGSKVKLLGMVVLPSGKITVDAKLKKKIEVLLHFYVNDKNKFNDLIENDYDSSLAMISGQLNYINTIDKDYLNKLRKKYGNYVIDIFFHKSVS